MRQMEKVLKSVMARPVLYFNVVILILLSIYIVSLPSVEAVISFLFSGAFIFSFAIGVGSSIFAECGIKSGEREKRAHVINDFVQLHKKMTDEMSRILNDKNTTNEHLYIISFTPAFGNISEPALYVNYRKLLEDIVKNNDRKVDVKIICYDENKRLEYHKYWAKIKKGKEDTNENIDEKISRWEREAVDVITLVRDNCGDNAVIAVDHIHPILFFSSSNIIMQYMIKNPDKDSTEMKSEVFGSIYPSHVNGKDFFNQAFKQYQKTHIKGNVTFLFEKHLKDQNVKNKYITAAHSIKNKLTQNKDGKLLVNNNVLLAYGGGKDSTLALLFVRLAQEFSMQITKKPFKLHIVVHVHPGMREDVFDNIDKVFNALGLYDDKENVVINYQTKNVTMENIKNEIPKEVKDKFRREILLLGHMSKGLGRSTFCYTCNMDMIMAIISYIYGSKDKIDYIITGDSRAEKKSYSEWLGNIFSYAKGRPVNISDYEPKTFMRDFIKLTNMFQTEYGLGGEKINENRFLVTYPELFSDIHKDLHDVLKDFREMLQSIGFSMTGISSSFSETDCYYPRIMAHMAGLRGGEEHYSEYLKAYLKHPLNFMKTKGFDDESINNAEGLFQDNSTRIEIEDFVEKKLDITPLQLESLVYSPFLEDGVRLDDFLAAKKEHHLNSADIICFVKGDTNAFDDIKIKDIKDFLIKYIGITNFEDLKTIMKYCENPDENSALLAKISKCGDPYVNVDAKVMVEGVEYKEIHSGR